MFEDLDFDDKTLINRRSSLLYPQLSISAKKYYHKCQFQPWHTGLPVPEFEVPRTVMWAKGMVMGVLYEDGKAMMLFEIQTVESSHGCNFEGWR